MEDVDVRTIDRTGDSLIIQRLVVLSQNKSKADVMSVFSEQAIQTRQILGLPALISLSDAHDEELCGGKAASQAQMIRLGLRVPPGVVVTNAVFQRFLDDNELRASVNALVNKLGDHHPTRLSETASKIREMILRASVAPEFLSALFDWYEKCIDGANTLIIRSSGVGEDSDHASFAGQLDSIPNVGTKEQLEHALKACWASYWNERSLSYQRHSGQYLRGMAVIIQKQVHAALSGVLFTVSPDQSKHRSNQMLAEYCYGAGSDLVSGHINPGRLSISRDNLQWQELAQPDQAETLPGARLDEKLLNTLAKMGLRLEEEFGRPQDIEWTMDHDRELFLVQSRPITVSASTTVTPPVITWSNANVNENFPDPISPLLYSIASAGYARYFRNLGRAFGISSRRLTAMDQPFSTIIGVHGARIYYNLSSIHAVLRMVPFGEEMVDFFNNFVGAKENTVALRSAHSFGSPSRSKFSQVLELVNIGVKTSYQFLFLTRRIRMFEDTVDQFAGQTKPNALKEKSLVELTNDLRAFMDIRLNRWTNASLADAASMICYGVLKKLLNKVFPNADEASLHNSLLRGLTNLASSEPTIRLWDLSRLIVGSSSVQKLFDSESSETILSTLKTHPNNEEYKRFLIALNTFLDDWGYRCSGELMLTVPNFQENPATLIDILRIYITHNGDSPVDVLNQQNAQRIQQTKEVLQRLDKTGLSRFIPWPTTAWLVRRFLTWTQRAISFRERARSKQALLYSRVRYIALAIADQFVSNHLLADRADIFFFTYEEILDLASSRAMFPYHTSELIERRKAAHSKLSAMDPPNAFELEEGSYLDIERNQAVSESAAESGNSKLEIRGTSACGGSVEGRATILNDVSESNLLKPGDILVTRQTDPGWGAIFFLIKGLIIERGGLLSHGAILAREFGIPAVVGIKDATRLIPQGSTIALNADQGVVKIVE